MAKRTKAASILPSSRWFRVTGPRFDWFVKRNVMISFPHGSIGYRPQACIDAGVAAGVIEVIEKPGGYSVDKAGNVVGPQKIETIELPDCNDPMAEPMAVQRVVVDDVD